MKRVIIIGAGEGGSALLEVLSETDQLEVLGVVDKDPNSVGKLKCIELNIPLYKDWHTAVNKLAPIDVIIEVTGDQQVYDDLRHYLKNDPITVIPSSIASIMFYLMEEKEILIEEVKNHNDKMNNILNSTHDGMIAIDGDEKITLINKRAEEMTSLSAKDVIGQKIRDVMATSKLPRVLRTKTIERNRKQTLSSNRAIITTRVPMFSNGQLIGALGVFRDITEIVKMAEEVTNLKSIQTMLEAIIYSSDDAISVVDEKGIGLLINPAYTRITGLTEDQVIGKPATTDISEGESMHMQVLQTKRAVRGAKMKVGPYRKDVIVNVAPVIVDDTLKGSVGVIHDMSEMEELTHELERAKQIIRTLEAKYHFEDIIGGSTELTFAIQQAKVAAGTPASIFLRGESGTGKELFAHAIHNESNRKYNKFIRVNCAAISETLLESELFGYEEGAFSGAKRGGKKGFFEEANNGSIFLDEIGELSPNMQAKLLRVLQEHEIVRVGGAKPVEIDVRVIAATNVDMENRIAEKEFRSDLYYRLNRMPIYIPSLRERKEDLLDLSLHLISKLNQDYGRNVEGVANDALSKLVKYDWPGNVRELENILGRAMIHMNYTDKVIKTTHLPLLSDKEVANKTVLPQTEHQLTEKTLQEMMEDQEKKILTQALEQNKGNKTKTAQMLSVSVRNLYYKLDKYGL
ncbi:sigma-54-dependent Fis family transcriptional regulator [Salipaludibacillus keqinensis]|uniref:Sigma-54-dependent Fis family transcriptional regulator n=1 Tax=Salipaludibacillus keqinensis TaxID=2045207 RepID=A0A323TKY3_9BACI|nr:sigma-54-dependent Fis family transcriptional regulator [Salipaludibacillus keqinensis]PYZ94367.1 sigma-54-dependent Fis family transcriptional regulator [Salipaludibacillus keqinensis]